MLLSHRPGVAFLTPDELRSAHRALGLSAEGAARFFRISSGRTIRGWWSGERNGKPADVPGPVLVLTEALMESRAVRRYFNLSLPEDPTPKSE